MSPAKKLPPEFYEHARRVERPPAGMLMAAMSQAEARVLAETQRFREALPGLLGRYEHRWVVFRDGQVQSDHRERAEALVAAVKAFGFNGGFVVTRVQPPSTELLNAAVAFVPWRDEA